MKKNSNLFLHEIIYEYGDKTETFNLVIKWKINFCFVKNKKYGKSKGQYIEHLMKLRYNKEFETRRNNINNKQNIFVRNNNNIFELEEFIFNDWERHIRK